MSEEVHEKEKRITDYIKSMVAIEESMEPYKEQKRALKGNYVENGWLSKEEISLAVKAYRMVFFGKFNGKWKTNIAKANNCNSFRGNHR